MRRTDDVGAALRTCVVTEPTDQPVAEVAQRLAEVDGHRLADRALQHGVGNFVYLHARSGDVIDARVLARLEQGYASGIRHHLRVAADLAVVAEALSGEGIPWITFKGPVLSELAYKRPDLRAYNDVDVLVHRRQFQAAVQALEKAGARLIDTNWLLLRRMEPGQLHLALPFGTLLDIHWHVVNGPAIRRSTEISVSQLFERARPVTVGGIPLSTFGTVDTVVHLSLHAGLAGAVRLLWLKDVERSIASGRPPWGEVLETARSWCTGALVGAVLQRTRSTVDADVPEYVTAGLAPTRAGHALNDAFDRLWPVEGAAKRTGPAALWVQYRRDSLRSSVAAIGGRARWRVMIQAGAASRRPDDQPGRDAREQAERALYFAGLQPSPPAWWSSRDDRN